MAQEISHQLQIAGPETSQTFLVSMEKTTIGRQAGNDLVLDHFLVSRRHAQLDCTGMECTLTDLNSANGVVIEGQRLQAGTPFPLTPGTVFQIGPYNITYVLLVTELPAVEPEPEPQPQPEPEPRRKPKPQPKPEPQPEPEPVAELPAGVIAEPQPEQREPVVTDIAELTPEPPDVPPPPVIPPPPSANGDRPSPDLAIPPGLSKTHSRYLEYLPAIYHTDFLTRFLAMLESIMTPIEWNVDNFDLFLDPEAAPEGFLPWLANWFELTFDDTWSEAQQRTILAEAHEIYARRGTKWALTRVLEIYLGVTPQIDDQDKNLPPFTFAITVPRPERGLNRALIEGIIDVHKPAHTSYTLTFGR